MTLINEGGSFFMISLIILLFSIVALIVKGFRNNTQKNLELLKSISLFALVFGLFGFVMGLIYGLDAVDASMKPEIVASGIKRSLLPPAFGSFIFLLGRVAVIALIGMKKK